jgi:hypothetical protein
MKPGGSFLMFFDDADIFCAPSVILANHLLTYPELFKEDQPRRWRMKSSQPCKTIEVAGATEELLAE